jgi:hypothetical protein
MRTIALVLPPFHASDATTATPAIVRAIAQTSLTRFSRVNPIWNPDGSSPSGNSLG